MANFVPTTVFFYSIYTYGHVNLASYP